MNATALLLLAAWSIEPMGGSCLISGPVGIVGKANEEQVALIVEAPDGPVLRYSIDGAPPVEIESEHRIGPQVGWFMDRTELRAAASITLDGKTVIDISRVPLDAIDPCAAAPKPQKDHAIWSIESDEYHLLPPLEEDPD